MRQNAELIAQELREIYPLPELVTTRPTTSLGEVRRPHAPSVLAEIGYHDNYDDAEWIENNIPGIAEALARALTEYFDLPFIYPTEPFSATVRVNYGTLNLRERPDSDAAIIAALGLWIAFRTVNYPTFADFLVSVEAEMSKVSWPTWKELYVNSKVVLLFMALFTILIFIFDIIFYA